LVDALFARRYFATSRLLKTASDTLPDGFGEQRRDGISYLLVLINQRPGKTNSIWK
jgi:hypothetical protein